ncbi:MAG: hypothetical protein AYK19_04125 [Theionarchaea archaeon DG-70-1]|nr:MAG: hypothetical protein AYK19_04125 [Theionarchaea archaeon DG-70-1]
MEIIDLNGEKNKHIIERILLDPLIVLVGAEISLWQPTNLSSGEEFVNLLFNLIFSKPFSDANPKTKPSYAASSSMYLSMVSNWRICSKHLDVCPAMIESTLQLEGVQ